LSLDGGTDAEIDEAVLTELLAVRRRLNG
jgi:hypothetical protein